MYLDDPEIWLTETVAEPSPELMCVSWPLDWSSLPRNLIDLMSQLDWATEKINGFAEPASMMKLPPEDV